MAETIFNTSGAIAAGVHPIPVEDGRRITLACSDLDVEEVIDIYYNVAGGWKPAYKGDELVQLTSTNPTQLVVGPITVCPVKAATAGAVVLEKSSWSNL
jgi:hypothetical protein